jgi:uncharacterized membrane protein YhaH (DUF805 family)
LATVANATAPQPRRAGAATREDIMHWYTDVLKRYADFKGRARRSEYWYFFLCNLAIAIVLAIVDSIVRKLTGLGFNPLGTLYALIVIVPGIAVTVRRLHDTDRSGWWVLLGFVPFAGLVLIVFLAQEGVGTTNRFGINPKLAIA